jgi:hypothetical protein
VFLAFCSDTQAQTPASSLPNLSLLVGERIEVTDEVGSVRTGRLLRVSETSLVLEAEAIQLLEIDQKGTEVLLRRIQRISRWERDSVANGIVYGALIGFGTSLGIGAIASRYTDEPVGGMAFLPSLGIGMAIGGIVDASRHRKIPIFQAEVPRVAVAPMLTGGRKGIAVSVRF